MGEVLIFNDRHFEALVVVRMASDVIKELGEDPLSSYRGIKVNRYNGKTLTANRATYKAAP
ncbi:hypothetical protein GCM10007086_24940 [Photobacterium aphoticum]|uniref:Uncharacterized protein n=1 Tax=Photobacterium aphoticum TaxID=754436 RepID=A0A0J1JH48_9GAMM|nr:hypothetical protein ABT58_08945 [Photobacterium aphoticum]GHA50047.1 hypothetical protein GCM10007086_24940 [Photobacterium aphoticum]